MMKKNLNNHKIDYYYYKNDISKQEEKNQKKQGWYEEREGGIDLIFDDVTFWALFVGVLKRSYFAAAALVSFQVCQFADGRSQGEIRKKKAG